MNYWVKGGSPEMANVLKCPICGCDVISSQLELLVAPSMPNESDPKFVVCHCPKSHRFIVTLKESGLTISIAA